MSNLLNWPKAPVGLAEVKEDTPPREWTNSHKAIFIKNCLAQKHVVKRIVEYAGAAAFGPEGDRVKAVAWYKFGALLRTLDPFQLGDILECAHPLPALTAVALFDRLKLDALLDSKEKKIDSVWHVKCIQVFTFLNEYDFKLCDITRDT